MSEAVRAWRLRASGALLERLVQPGKVRAPFLLVSFVTDGSQPGMGHHGQCDMAMPTMPVANFIMVQPGFAFGFFDALLNGVASGSDLSQCEQGRWSGALDR